MISIVWYIFVVIFVISVIKKAANKGDTKGQTVQQVYRQMMQQTQQAWQQNTQAQRTVSDQDRAKLEEYRKKKTQGTYVPSRPVTSNQDLDANRQRRMEQPDIVERAKANSKRFAAQDNTLEEMESGHGHSEKVSSAVAGYVERERAEHRRMHEEPRAPIEAESSLGTVEDLIVKGYDGNLSFERDFIGEAQEFLANITVPG